MADVEVMEATGPCRVFQMGMRQRPYRLCQNVPDAMMCIMEGTTIISLAGIGATLTGSLTAGPIAQWLTRRSEARKYRRDERRDAYLDAVRHAVRFDRFVDGLTEPRYAYRGGSTKEKEAGLLEPRDKITAQLQLFASERVVEAWQEMMRQLESWDFYWDEILDPAQAEELREHGWGLEEDDVWVKRARGLIKKFLGVARDDL